MEIAQNPSPGGSEENCPRKMELTGVLVRRSFCQSRPGRTSGRGIRLEESGVNAGSNQAGNLRVWQSRANCSLAGDLANP